MQEATHNAIAGVWKLTAYARRFLDTGEVRYPDGGSRG